MNLILIGYRGSGKTSVGRLLSDKLQRAFFDVDDLTCQRFGMDSIAEIWQRHGESRWREMEVEVTRELCGRDHVVIGLGGGTLMQPGARQAVEDANALRIYLHADATELHRRIAGDTRSSATRPNLTNLGGGVAEIEHVLKQRGPVYEAVADHVVEVSRLSVAQVANEILQLVM